MPHSSSAFTHHPELQDFISDPMNSFFRDFNARAIFEERPELHWVLELLSTDSEREASRLQAMDGRQDRDLLIFAYGSLMWDPALRFSKVRRAAAPGYARHFILKDIYGGRGTPETPGLMAALDHGEGCEGLVFQIASEDIETETEILWRREMVGKAYHPAFIDVTVDGQPLEALTFVADHAADSMCTQLTREEQVRFISTGSGFMGTSLEYLKNIVSQFSALNIVDEDCTALLAEVEQKLSASHR